MSRACRTSLTGTRRLRRGFVHLYRSGVHCPACGGGAWIIGRVHAQCGRCETALPIADSAGAHG